MKKFKHFSFKAVVVTLSSLFLVVLFIFLLLNYFVIGKIICESQFGYCNSETDKYLKDFEGRKYFKSVREIKKYLRNNISVKESSIRLLFPNNLAVYTVERKPFYAIKVQDVYDLISQDGILLSTSKVTSLPYLNLNEKSINIGDMIDNETIFALRLLKYLNYLYGVKTGNINDNGIEFRIQDGPLLIVPKIGDLKVLVGSIQLILQNISNKTWEYSLEKAYNQITIDLRYKNPIIK